MGYSDYSHGYSEYSDRVRITTSSTFIAVLRYGAADPKNHDYVVIEGGEFKKGGKIITFSVRRTQQQCKRATRHVATYNRPHAPCHVLQAACRLQHALLASEGRPDRSLVLLRGPTDPSAVQPMHWLCPSGTHLLSACRLPSARMAPKAETCA
jgi:hypothetical protein